MHILFLGELIFEMIGCVMANRISFYQAGDFNAILVVVLSLL